MVLLVTLFVLISTLVFNAKNSHAFNNPVLRKSHRSAMGNSNSALTSILNHAFVSNGRSNTVCREAVSKGLEDRTSTSVPFAHDGNNSDFDEVLRSRRTINNFLPELPDGWEDDVRNAVASALHAPNHKRTEPWRFHLLGPETVRKVCELNASIVAAKKGDAAGDAKLKRWLKMPGWLVVTCETKTTENAQESTMDEPTGSEREDYAACCCAVQNFCLSLHNAGLGTKWTTGPVNFHPRFAEIVGFEKNEYVVGTIWFGTPETIPDAPIKKKSVEDILINHG